MEPIRLTYKTSTMKNLILLLLTVTLISCSTEQSDCCTIIDTAVSIKYVNGDGENLLETDNNLSVNDINIYHKIDNEWIAYYKGNLDRPKGIAAVQTEEGLFLEVFPSSTIVENSYSETKIEFSESEADILRTEIDRSNSNEIVTKVWYNDELKWEGNNAQRSIEIIK